MQKLLQRMTMPGKSSYHGKPFPLGATYDGHGVNFAIYSENATGIDLCLFDTHGNEMKRIPLRYRWTHVWYVYVEDLQPGQLYGYRVDGPYEPEKGFRFNKNKLLLDPYAKAISGDVQWNDAVFSYQVGDEHADLSFSTSDSQRFMPKCIVVDERFDWEGDQLLRLPYESMVIYEAHVKGLTMLNEKLPPELRGTYAGIGHPSTIEYLKDLGVNTIELMPVHHCITSRQLRDKGLNNYWGYDTIGFFAPDIRFACDKKYGSQVMEFKSMVKSLHRAGIEVILDVVYNHTPEGNEMGPTLSMRGVDNTNYYKLTDDGRYYMDYTGTGNTLNVRMPNVLRLIMDSLRYWILEMHVDGFRFDLAASLARELHEVDRLSAFFDVIYQDPFISQAKLIAEPWDVGEGGYQVGNFPPQWAEWNGKYRDTMRNFWRGQEHHLGDFATRFSGSPDLYRRDYKQPTSSINFITAHDGFTLRDLVSYNGKHNEANGENNMDGNNDTRSWNCGQEGPTDDEQITKLRAKQQRNFLTTLILSQGVPMLRAGDEIGHSQQGNNNAYCQDNDISWLSWPAADWDLHRFTRSLIAYRHKIFQKYGWFQGAPRPGRKVKDIAWLQPNGDEMEEEHWRKNDKTIAIFLDGNKAGTANNDDSVSACDSFYFVFNAHDAPVRYQLPGPDYAASWTLLIDTDKAICEAQEHSRPAGDTVEVEAHSIYVFRGDEK